MSDLAIQTNGLTKRFGAQAAVDGIDLAVPQGAVYGFLGPNGSGKTTTIRMLLGLVRATDGSARVLGSEMPRHLDAVLPRVGALVEGPAFAPFLSGASNLRRFDAADRHAAPTTRGARVAEALDRVGLAHAARKKAGAYSLGMKQRLGLANALLMPRDLLVLDEPTNGLDPQGTREVRSLIRSFAADGTTVFVSSHLLAEVEQLCTHVGVMSAGRLVAQGTLEEFRRSGESRVEVLTPDSGRARAVLARLGLVTDAAGTWDPADAGEDGTVSAVLGDSSPEPDAIVAALVGDGVRVRGFAVRRESLEQRFVELTGEGFDVVG
ncbi:ABC-2 type transport system ATP-binding protein [Agromyces flavus]|uniref:ABC-2 type transport system ATP-binding protein n=1 Tax=Agromyces flavus TaxID=589382 RepID=A0A1H1ZH35_9MICO|nr:ABC transporter ATP-binding protein [Agromyces flavus]MCP2367072.1 ABC-2 type transport system ATP-binding protein [Agromyces flavus]GGI46456.1 ABC transporter ATP-binding protein [Agromyces flavus]SDT32516.1 ABC-2 type transport system ATP-binding protein [Agromyces flavus]